MRPRLAILRGQVPVPDFLLPWSAARSSATAVAMGQRLGSSLATRQREERVEAGPSEPHGSANGKGKGKAKALEETVDGPEGMHHYGIRPLDAPPDASPTSSAQNLRSTAASPTSISYRPPWRRKSLLSLLEPPTSPFPPRLAPSSSASKFKNHWIMKDRDDPIVSSLSGLNPPSPTTLYDHLRTDLPGLSKQRGELVVRYANRINNVRLKRETQDLMGRMRVGPLEWVKRERRRRKRPAIVPFLEPVDNTLQAITPIDESSFPPVIPSPPPRAPRIPLKISSSRTFARDIPPHSPLLNIALSSITTRSITSLLPLPSQDLKKQPQNSWASKRWPVTTTIRGNAKLRTPEQILTHLHSLLLNDPNSAPDIHTAFAIGEHLPISPEVRARYNQDVLHVYLAYTPTPPDGQGTLSTLHHLIDSSTALQPTLVPSRQTLHLLVLRLLSTLRDNSTSSIIRDLLDSFEKQWEVSPGCETLRHISQYAFRTDDRELAKESWNAWWTEYARMCSFADLEAMNNLSREDGAPSEVRPRAKLRGDLGEIKFRFQRKGKQLARWWRVVKNFEKRGWIERVEFEGQGREPTRYRWAEVSNPSPQLA